MKQKARLTVTLPDAVTLAGLLAGFLSLIFTLQARYQIAACFIIAALFTDSIDGYLARRLKKTSSLGGQLDSLADLTSFGLAPGLLMYAMYSSSMWAATSMLVPMCAALRLARFNITFDQGGFTGLPTPVVGGVLASIPFFSPAPPAWSAALLMGIVSMLMISNISYVGYKDVRPWEKRPPLSWMIVVGVFFLGLLFDMRLLLASFGFYILVGPLNHVFKR